MNSKDESENHELRMQGLHFLGYLILLDSKFSDTHLVTKSDAVSNKTKSVLENYDTFIKENGKKFQDWLEQIYAVRKLQDLEKLYAKRTHAKNDSSAYDQINSEIRSFAIQNNAEINELAIDELIKPSEQGPKEDAKKRLGFIFPNSSVSRSTLKKSYVEEIENLINETKASNLVGSFGQDLTIPLTIFFELCGNKINSDQMTTILNLVRDMGLIHLNNDPR